MIILSFKKSNIEKNKKNALKGANLYIFKVIFYRLIDIFFVNYDFFIHI